MSDVIKEVKQEVTVITDILFFPSVEDDIGDISFLHLQMKKKILCLQRKHA